MGHRFSRYTIDKLMFSKYLGESNRKPNKIWVDKGRAFYSRSMKSFLQNNNIEMYSTHNEGKVCCY